MSSNKSGQSVTASAAAAMSSSVSKWYIMWCGELSGWKTARLRAKGGEGGVIRMWKQVTRMMSFSYVGLRLRGSSLARWVLAPTISTISTNHTLFRAVGAPFRLLPPTTLCCVAANNDVPLGSAHLKTHTSSFGSSINRSNCHPVSFARGWIDSF
ncbi:hypothetical protein F5888DRAFT_1055725 [Russula emetica]|nr:hypothetical protein F5888DRAFT_1055725 [Russula emetica]